VPACSLASGNTSCLASQPNLTWKDAFVKILCLFSTDMMPWVIARHWLKGVVDSGGEVYVGCPPGPYVRQLEEFGLPVREVYVSRNLNPINILWAIRSVHKLLKSQQWDILNCHALRQA